MKQGKRFRTAVEVTGANQLGDLNDAIERLKKSATAKFDETVEVSMNLGVDPRHAEQQVRGTVVLPHGTGKKIRVLVLTKGDKEREAKDAGADYAGSEEFIKRLNEGWLDIDSIIATPDMMGEVGKLGRVLGPRGLMPNPRSGTVTMDVAKAVREVKSGKIEYRVDKAGNLHAPVGKASFGKDQLVQNVEVFLREVIRQKPAAAKGQYLKSITLSSTMGPPVRLDPAAIQAGLKA
ncbi:MAG TPA: 50S ribosomal protein L1 [Candidatus Eisenbacteria bacterium]|jgi:large subunit ribosomal protein L1|nr:50S ribosomal protein L1 [Candidatus Eisenbacteria bacterium]